MRPTVRPGEHALPGPGALLRRAVSVPEVRRESEKTDPDRLLLPKRFLYHPVLVDLLRESLYSLEGCQFLTPKYSISDTEDLHH